LKPRFFSILCSVSVLSFGLFALTNCSLSRPVHAGSGGDGSGDTGGGRGDSGGSGGGGNDSGGSGGSNPDSGGSGGSKPPGSGGSGNSPASGGSGNSPGTGGMISVGNDDPTCSSFTVKPAAVLTPMDSNVATVVGQLTNDEKRAILSGGDGEPNWTDAEGTAFRSLGVQRLNITPFAMRDGPRGMRTIVAGEIGTTFASAEARAAAFDLDLERRVGKFQGLDMRDAHNDLALAPVVNTLRHPRWARAQETYGEDPVLLGEMGAAYVNGMQLEGQTAACPKHFVSNDTDNNRTSADPRVDEQTLRENYTRPFEIVVKKSDPACIMAAYNMVNDIHATQNKHLLTDILRTDWKWAGFVLSDWEAALPGQGAASINAGLDLEMPTAKAFTATAIFSADVTSDTLNKAVTRILNARYKFKNFDSNYLKSSKNNNLANKPDNIALAKETEVKGAVLLKNDGLLPIGSMATTAGMGMANVKTIAIVGPDNDIPTTPANDKANTTSGLGDRGSSQTSPPHVVSYAKGLMAAGFTVKQSADTSAASGADLVIIPVSMNHEDEGEAYGGGADRVDMTFSGTHPRHWTTKPTAFIKSVAAINKNVLVLLNVGSAIIVEDWIDSAKGVIQTFYPGQEGGTALAELLTGKSNFSGKLPFTVGQAESDYPPFNNSSPSFMVDYLHGYRHFEKNNKPVRYWFGYGQSYTTYKYSNLKVLCSKVSANGRLNVQVTVQNTGKVDGTEIVQLYIGYPNTMAARRPVKELKAFTRVTLAAGESKDVTLAVPAQDMAYWATGGWTVEKVVHKVLVGPSADPATLLSAEFTIQ
jgi:beta-glucosidase